LKHKLAWFVGDWFDADGKYIGPDADGVEPIFED